MTDIFGKRKIALLVLMILAMFILAGCDKPKSCVGEDLIEFYEDLGGEEVLGTCVSEPTEVNGSIYQYMQNALLIYNSNAPSAQRYSLGKIGYDVIPNLEVIPAGGYDVWEEAESTYLSTGGKLGLALSEVLREDEYHRYVQYFEGAALYRDYADAPGVMHWLPYGWWFCDTKCPQCMTSSVKDMSVGPIPTQPVKPDVDVITRALVDYAKRLGFFFTGHLVTPKAYPAEDGWYEIVYENVVLAVDPNNLANIQLRRLPKILGYIADLSVSCVSQEGFICYPLEDGFVRMMPVVFYDFIIQNGGFELSGEPITNLRLGSGGTSYQCFENLCLEYWANAPAALQVSVMRLGLAYARRDMAAPFVTPNAPHMLLIETWPRYPSISANEPQEIYVQAMQGTLPVPGVLFSLAVTYPDGTVYEETFPLTDFNGQAYLTLDPITAPEGTNIPYVACYQGGAENSVCIPGVFTVWSYAP